MYFRKATLREKIKFYISRIKEILKGEIIMMKEIWKGEKNGRSYKA